MSSDDFSGWAIRRNNSCVGEVDCGETRAPFRACCPSSTACPSQYNVACCPFGQNCTAAAVEAPRCANGSWAMFDNGGYFCCEKGYIGYNYQGTDGCSRSGFLLPDDAVPLAEVTQVSISSSVSSSATSISPTTAPEPASQSSTDSNSASTLNNSAPVGAIVGGVLGGIAFLVVVIIILWFIRRKKAREEGAMVEGFILNQEPPKGPSNEKYAATVTPGRVEIDGSSRVELSNDAATRYELA
ncbi:hypothetical protein F5Y11DRAFT_330360 [Daldinia sp. FL1419]|nr:hypothetical protein F5Y11DRAFT_330360 [Daldinia sp. FL1419]